MVGGCDADLAAGRSIATRLETYRRKEYPGSKAVLVAIAIPVFTSQLEKSREATDASNIRAAYAEVMVAALNGSTDGLQDVSSSGSEGSFVFTKEVELKQQQDGWQNTSIGDVGGVDVATGITGVGAGKTCTVTYTQSTGVVTFPVS